MVRYHRAAGTGGAGELLRRAAYAAAACLLLAVQGWGTSGWVAAAAMGLTAVLAASMPSHRGVAVVFALGASLEGAISFLGWQLERHGDRTWGLIWAAVLIAAALGARRRDEGTHYVSASGGDGGPGTESVGITAPVAPAPDELRAGAEAEPEEAVSDRPLRGAGSRASASL